MLKQLKRNWSSLTRGRPGSRFQEQYDRQRNSRSSKAGRVLRLAAGVILLPLGLFLLPAPGPGTIVVVIGALLIAREFKVAAQFLDRLEVRGRNLFRWAKRTWRRMRAHRATSR